MYDAGVISIAELRVEPDDRVDLARAKRIGQRRTNRSPLGVLTNGHRQDVGHTRNVFVPVDKLSHGVELRLVEGFSLLTLTRSLGGGRNRGRISRQLP